MVRLILAEKGAFNLMRHKLELNAERFSRYPTGLIYSGALCLFFCLNVVTLPSFGQVVKRGPGATDEGQEIRRKLLAPAFKMLKAEDLSLAMLVHGG